MVKIYVGSIFTRKAQIFFRMAKKKMVLIQMDKFGIGWKSSEIDFWFKINIHIVKNYFDINRKDLVVFLFYLVLCVSLLRTRVLIGSLKKKKIKPLTGFKFREIIYANRRKKHLTINHTLHLCTVLFNTENSFLNILSENK